MEALFLSAYAPAVIRSPFPQYDPLTAQEFIRFLDRRGFHVTKDDLEFWEREYLLAPFARLNRPSSSLPGRKYAGALISPDGLKEYDKAGLLAYPQPGDFIPWSSYRDGYEETTLLLYHPYQEILVDHFFNWVRFQVKADILSEGAPVLGLDKMRNFYNKFKEAFIANRPSLVRRIGLLLKIQDVYQPRYRGSFQACFLDDEALNKWVIWVKESFSPKYVLNEIGLSIQEVKEWRDWLAVQAHARDPLRKWYMLARLAPYRKKSNLEGKALLAQDYYELVFMINWFLEELTGDRQPEPDDILDGLGGGWKPRFYGEPFDYSNSSIRKKIVDEFLIGILPKILVLAHGETEEKCLEILLETFGVNLESAGITIYNYEGTGGIKGRNVIGLLKYAKRNNVERYLFVDNDENASKYIDDLVEHDDLIERDRVRLWKSEFEEDNFPREVILNIINTRLQAQSGLSVSDLLRVTYGDMHSQIEKGANYVHLRMLRGKRKELGFFDIFFGRTSVEALKQYLLTREGLESSSRLFPCTARNVNSFLERMSERAGLGWNVSSHDLRKFFATNLKLARVNDPAFNETLIEYWQGHSLGKVKGAYFVPPVEEQLRLYMLAEERLEP